MKTTNKEKYIIVEAENGILTEFKEGNDISTYNSFLKAFLPLALDLSTIREITAEEDKAYKEQQEAFYKEKEEEVAPE